MYNQLKEMMPEAVYFYGPMLQQEAFNIPVHSWAIPLGIEWYAGTTEEIKSLKDREIKKSIEK